MTHSQETIRLLLMHFHTAAHMQIHCFKDGVHLFSTAALENAAAYIPENPFLCDPELFSRLIVKEHGDMYFQSDEEEPDIFYGIFQYENFTLLLGPLTVRPLATARIHAYMKRHRMHDFVNYTIRVCTIAETGSLLTLLSFILCGEFRYPAIPFSRPDEAADCSDDYALQSYRLSNSELQRQHVPYRMEQQMMNAVQNGDEKVLSLFNPAASDYTAGTMSHSALKQEEYSAVIGVSLMSRAAIQGGVNPYDAYDLNDLYLQRISCAGSPAEYSDILKESVHGYLTAVNRARNAKSQSIHIEKCKLYISKHLNIPFKLQDLADDTGLNPTYLSGLFQKYEQQTIKEYTLRERIAAAENMLKFSDYTISQIAEYFCFHSQSHFGSVFKRITGKTPAFYRRSNKIQGF